MPSGDQHSFGVFKPVGHLVISFPDAARAERAAAAFAAMGLEADALVRYTDQEFLVQIEQDLRQASPLAALGQEINLILAHRALAELGYHWLVVRVADDEQARLVAATAEDCGAERAQHYGHFIIEDLIDRPGNLPQINESPDRGLDAQTPSGLETEAAELKRRARG